MGFQLLNVFTLEMSDQFPLIRTSANIKPFACFRYGESSFLILKNNNNYTTIFKGTQKKMVNGFKFDSIYYDNIQQKLYAIDSGNIYLIDLNSLNNIFTYPGILNSKPKINKQLIQKINPSYNVKIINDHLFLINRKNISLCLIHSPCIPQPIKLNSPKFNLFLPPIKPIYIDSPSFPLHWLVIAISLNIPSFLLSYFIYRKYNNNYEPISQIPLINLPKRSEIFTSV